MAHTKAGGSTKLGRDSQPKYLGIKRHEGARVQPGSILVRQRGTSVLAGTHVKQGGDDTLYAMQEGIVRFSEKRKVKFDGTRIRQKVVNVESK
ncbi:MAG: 50S ribosomal protein L27 [bacterium]|nr:50S ribosomal protein L27 [bacterium]